MSSCSLNVGILGHVDAGKTTLTRAIASIASTNAFDKHAEKEGRHNTIDLGFSSLFVGGRRLSLVDCPGHASLIRAVLAASNVFDIAIVLVDASRGIEPQTAEHLLLAGFFCPDHVMVLINKIDLVTSEQLESLKKRVRKSLKAVGVREDSAIRTVSLANAKEEDIRELITAFEGLLYTPLRDTTSPFLMAIDHCFAVKGKGTIMTGTVLSGETSLNSEVEIPCLQERRKVKGIQSWKEAVEKVSAGERGALLLPNLSADSIQRTLICHPSTLENCQRALCTVDAVEFYKGTVPSGRKFHISIGFETVMADCHFLRPCGSEFEYLAEMTAPCVVDLHFEKKVFTRENSFFIAAKLDHQGKGCRFAFHGRLLSLISDDLEVKKFVRKTRSGMVERIENERSLICKDLFKKETKMSLFEGMCVLLSTGETGRIESSFGKSGKVRVAIPGGLHKTTIEMVEKNGEVRVELHMRKYLSDRKMVAYIPEVKSTENDQL